MDFDARFARDFESDDLSLEDLFAAADAIADHRSAKERYRMARKLKRAQAALAEVIGSDCEQQ